MSSRILQNRELKIREFLSYKCKKVYEAKVISAFFKSNPGKVGATLGRFCLPPPLYQHTETIEKVFLFPLISWEFHKS